MREAEALVANGLGFESGLSDAIDAARDDGVPVYEVAPDVRPIGDDPHWFTDPSRMADAVPLIAAFLERAADLPAAPLDERAGGYVADVMAADAQIEATLRPIAPAQRKLVTSHESFTYFADRYDFELVGAVIEGTSTESEPSAQDLDDLARLVVQEDVPAVFGETTHSPRLIEALVRETGVDVRIVTLDSESLGAPGTPADTYIGMMTHDAELIAGALR
jgi:zinc/manganese transport system substrate-binding protein